MKKIFSASVPGIFIILLFGGSSILFAQTGPFATDSSNKPLWSVHNPFEHKVFIENKGQFDGRDDKRTNNIGYAIIKSGMEIYFTPQGLTYRHDTIQRLNAEERREKERKYEEKVPKVISHYAHMVWIGAALNVQITAEDPVSHYFTYSDPKDKSGKSGIKALAYKKIIYKNIYPNIDVEYTFPENKDGIKYTLILHPGADVSLIKMKYTDHKELKTDAQGNVIIKTAFGDIIDHAPICFYADDRSPVPSSFELKNNTLSFGISNYDNSRTLIIDPLIWTMNPAHPTFNSSYDVEYDFQGNVYVYGGNGPFQEKKYSSTGLLLWTYTDPFFVGLYGDFAVDANTGRSYLVEGFSAGRVVKLSAAGLPIGTFPGNSNLPELWRIVFNNCTKQGIIGGGGAGNVTYQAMVLDTNVTAMTPVNVLNSPESQKDIALLAIDNSNNCYMGTQRDAYHVPPLFDNVIFKCPANTLTPTSYVLSDNYAFIENLSIKYVKNLGGMTNGFNGMAATSKFLYTYDGQLIQRWNKNTGALINSASISPAAFVSGGLAVDDCDHIFAGSQSSILQLDTNFTVISTIPAPNTVYDVRIAPGNLLYFCGKNFVSSFQVTGTSVSCAVTPTMSVTASSAIATCSSPGSASVIVTGGTSPYTYSWMPTGQTTQAASGLPAGTYSVTVIDASVSPCGAPNNLTQTTTVTVASSGVLTTSVTSTFASCTSSDGSGTVTPLGGTPNYTYNWNPGGQTTATATGLGTGNYTVTVTDASGCIGTSIVVITSSAGQTVSIASQTNVSCFGANTGIAAVNVTGGTAPYTYNWSPTGGTNASATGLNAGNYSCTVTDVNGCIAIQPVAITEPTNITAIISATNTDCGVSNGIATATANGGIAPFTYIWNNGQTGQSVTGLSAGNYSVAITDAAGCTNTQTVNISQTSSPTITANASSDTISSGASVVLTATGGGTYQWSPVAGLSCVTCANPTATLTETTSYCVVVTDANNCSDSVCVTIIVEIPCGNLYLPNAFSPNNDLENDMECLIGSCVISMHLIIYDRWGEKVFESTDQKDCWDGTYKGILLNSAVFSYHLEATLQSGEKIVKTGNISLIR